MTNPMTNPNFESMPRRELLDYILKHREDEDAFRAYMDRAYAVPNRVWHPAPKSIEDLSHFPQLLEENRRRLEEERRKEQGEQA
jgi:hypothetical protein